MKPLRISVEDIYSITEEYYRAFLVIGSEWREHLEETNANMTSKQLLRILRLRRNREQYIAEFGEKRYRMELSNCHYGVYQMLGKLCPIVYTLTK